MEYFLQKHLKHIFIILKNITQLVKLMDGLAQNKIEDDNLPTSSPEQLQKINAAWYIFTSNTIFKLQTNIDWGGPALYNYIST